MMPTQDASTRRRSPAGVINSFPSVKESLKTAEHRSCPEGCLDLAGFSFVGSDRAEPGRSHTTIFGLQPYVPRLPDCSLECLHFTLAPEPYPRHGNCTSDPEPFPRPTGWPAACGRRAVCWPWGLLARSFWRTPGARGGYVLHVLHRSNRSNGGGRGQDQAQPPPGSRRVKAVERQGKGKHPDRSVTQ